MENMTTPAVHVDVSYDGDYNWTMYGPVVTTEPRPIMSAVILSVVCVLGVLGNGVVIWATGFRMKKTVSTVWYLNLAVADFLVTAFLPLEITYRALDWHWPFGWFMCKMDAVVFYVNMYASIYTLVVISVDRCVCVVCPVWTRNHRTVRKASWVSLGVWVMALALSSMHFTSRYTRPFGEKFWCSEHDASRTTVSTANFLVGFVVPLSVIVSCYSLVIYRLGNNRLLAGQSGRSFKIIAAVIGAFFLCWAPYHVVRLIHATTKFSWKLAELIDFGVPITHALALVNSCVNPLLYVVFSQGFMDVFRCSRSILKVLEKAFAEEPPRQTSNSTATAVTQIALSEMEPVPGPQLKIACSRDPLQAPEAKI